MNIMLQRGQGIKSGENERKVKLTGCLGRINTDSSNVNEQKRSGGQADH